ncbi:MAG TPA: hypothetical protein VG898_01645 [Solirubrobacterales bacterium]|nr:hypothetical protein [Solirubrobacterales bacterium]
MVVGGMGTPDDEPTFRAVVPEGAHPELVEEEFDLFRRLMAMMEKRLPDIPKDRLGDLLPQARSEDPEIAAVAARLEEVVETHRGSVIRMLWENDERREGQE